MLAVDRQQLYRAKVCETDLKAAGGPAAGRQESLAGPWPVNEGSSMPRGLPDWL